MAARVLHSGKRVRIDSVRFATGLGGALREVELPAKLRRPGPRRTWKRKCTERPYADPGYLQPHLATSTN